MQRQEDSDLVRRCRALLPTLGKRPKTVLQRILDHGSVSTFDLGQLGYDQPPRAAQDLKEAGVRLKTTFDRHPETGARMAVYSLESVDDTAVFTGRRAIPKRLRDQVLAQYLSKCNICNVQYPGTALQLDHRVPYIVAGDSDEPDASAFQPLCGSHQRSKSWACEHCRNRAAKSVDVCRRCYWAYPDATYDHVALRPERRVDLTWAGPEEVVAYERIVAAAKRAGVGLSVFLKKLIAARN